MIKAIFWDNDGVLADTEQYYYEANRQILEHLGIPLTQELYGEICLIHGESVFSLLQGLSKEKLQPLRDKRDRIYEDLLRKNKLIVDGVETLFQEIHSHVTMGIVTSSRKDHFDIIHRSSHILQYVNFVLTQGDYERTKPAPDPYLVALKKTSLKKDECLVIEDSERGLRSAVSAGLSCYVIEHPMTRSGNFEKADKIFASLKELGESLKLSLQLNNRI